MFEQIKGILAQYTEAKEEAEIMEDSQLVADLELSSFDLVAIVMEFEDTYGIEIPDRDLGKFVCVSDILEYLRIHI